MHGFDRQSNQHWRVRPLRAVGPERPGVCPSPTDSADCLCANRSLRATKRACSLMLSLWVCNAADRSMFHPSGEWSKDSPYQTKTELPDAVPDMATED